jgi:hypothetical protein
MANYNFRKDLSVAKKTEKDVSKLLEIVCGAKILEFDETNKYDIVALINDKRVTFEIKEDFMCEQTGNVGVEFECRGKPSGIQTSEADYYIYKVHTKEYGIKYIVHQTKALKKMIENSKYFRIASGGDKGSNTQFYLFKFNSFIRNSKLLAHPIDKMTIM